MGMPMKDSGVITEIQEKSKPTMIKVNSERIYGCDLDDAIMSAQWRAFNKVLHWINEQDQKMISKGDLYDAVMDMRPEV